MPTMDLSHDIFDLRLVDGPALAPADDLLHFLTPSAMGPLGTAAALESATLSSLAGPVDLASEFETAEQLQATVDMVSMSMPSPLFYGSDSSSSSETDDVGIFPNSTPISAGLKADRFLFDFGSNSSLDSQKFSIVANKGERQSVATPYNASPKRPLPENQDSRNQLSVVTTPRPKPIKSFTASKADLSSDRSQCSSGNVVPRFNPPACSELASALLPKVDKPCLGDLNGKMPRPVIVNSSPRRKRKSDVSPRDIEADEEERKMKSVQSARDCRKRKKQYIQGLQQAIQQYEEREAAAQKLIQALRESIIRARSSLHSA